MLGFLCKNMEIALHNEETAWEIRRTQGTGKHIPDLHSNRELGSEGFSDGSEPIGTHRTDCEGIGGTTTWSKGHPGKIISALVEEARKQLNYHRQQAEILELRIKELEQTSNLINNE